MQIIGGKFRNHRLATPKGDLTRPTSGRLREAFFNICQTFIEDAHFLDIFAGSGAMGFEAISRHAASATFIDASKEAASCIEKNAKILSVISQCQILQGDAFVHLKRLADASKQFDIVFVDPPYNTKGKKELLLSQEILLLFDQYPLLSPDGSLFIEEDFRFQPETANLKHLKLVDARRMGPAALTRYKYIDLIQKAL